MKFFNDKEEILILKNYLAEIINKPTFFTKQKTVYDSNGKVQWCEEWEIIEMLKYIINGKENYYQDPPPNRLKESTCWSKEEIEKIVETDLGTVEDPNIIVSYFRKRRGIFNEVS